MRITKISPVSGDEHTMELDITHEQLQSWQNGMLIQDAFPNLNDDQREFLMTGIYYDEWDDLFEDGYLPLEPPFDDEDWEDDA